MLVKWLRKAKGVRGQIRCFTDSGNPAYTLGGGIKITINDTEATDPDDYPAVKKDAVPGEVLAITGRGPLVQTGEGQVILTDFAAEGGGADSFMALAGGSVSVILG